MHVSKASKPWILAHLVALAAPLAFLVTVLALRPLWVDVERMLARATRVELPFVAIALAVTGALALALVARALRIVLRPEAAEGGPGAGSALFLALLCAGYGLTVFALFARASDAVLVSELQHAADRLLGRSPDDGLPPRDVPAGARFDERVLFDGDADPKYVTVRIPGLVVTPGGVVLAYCEAREGYGDWAPIDLVSRRSPDGGETWEPPVVLQGGAGATANNPLMIAEAGSEAVHLLYAVDYARAFHRRSADGGRTWSEAREVTAAFEELRPVYDWRVIAFGPGHGIELRSGRLLAPVWLSPGGGHDGHHPQQVATLYSDDRGASWHAGQLVTPRDGPDHGEPVAVELSDGRVMLNMRNEDLRLGAVYRAVSTSPDGSRGWSPPRLDPALPDPISFGALQRYDERTILFANVQRSVAADWRLELFGYRGRREPLGVRVSWDDGRSWPVAAVLQRREAGHVDLTARDGTIYALFEQGWRRRNQYRTRTLRLARFDLAWVTSAARAGLPDAGGQP